MITRLLNIVPLHTGNRGIDKDKLWDFAQKTQRDFQPKTKSVSAVFRVKNVAHSLWPSYLSIAPLCQEIIIIDNQSTDDTAAIIALIADHCAAHNKRFIHHNYDQPIAAFGQSYQAAVTKDEALSIAKYYDYAFSFVTSDYAIKADAGCLFFPKALHAMKEKIDKNRPLIRMRGMEYYGKTMAYEPRLFSMSSYDGFRDGPQFEIMQIKNKRQKYDPRNFYLPPAYMHFTRLLNASFNKIDK